MRQDALTPSLLQRLGDRANLGVLCLIGGMFCLHRILAGPPGAGLAELALPFALLLAHLAFAPIPWQWTGDDAPKAELGRGLAQALAFNLVWVALVLALFRMVDHGGPEGPRPPPPPFQAMAPDAPAPPRPPRHREGAGLAGLGLVNLAFAIVFGWVMAGKEALEARERATAGLLRQSRSRSLQNQLEPHVLYNALNGLAELVHDDPPAAEEMIARLADLYRMLSHHGEAAFVPLMKERLLVETYLAMEDMRLGDRLRVSWTWPPWADGVLLPPLFLQPLVENAIKHGLSPCEEGGELRIAVTGDGPARILTVANTGRPLAPGAADGIGLANLKERLELWTETSAAFTLEQVGSWTVATIRWTEGRR